MTSVQRIGFTLLSDGPKIHQSSGSQQPVNIIFVHGLMGHPQNTWEGYQRKEQGESAKPEEKEAFTLLGPALPHARIWTYGYNADVTGGKIFQANNQNSISQHGRDLSVKLEDDIDNEDPIIFVAHSLGGIIVKDALDRSKPSQERTRSVVFLGTPHRGSQYSDWAQIAQNLVRLVGQDSNSKITSGLKVNSEILENIHGRFIDMVMERDIRIHSFQEARGIYGMSGLHNQVVHYMSSKCDLPTSQEKVETIDADHRQMAKFSDKDDSGFKRILKVLENFSKETTETRNPIFTSPSQPSDSTASAPLSKEERACLQSFYMGSQQIKSNIANRHPGTCEWLLRHPNFEKWIVSSRAAPLWITGNPGMGKTVLSKYLIEYFEKKSTKDHPINVVFGFFSHEEWERTTPIAILKGLIHQCLTLKEELVRKHVMPLYTSQGNAIFTSIHTLWTMFVAVMNDISTTLGEAVCVIDALDECEKTSRDELLRYLGEHISNTAGSDNKHGSYIITSRPYESIRIRLHRYSIIRLQAETDEKLINDDIATFVNDEIEQLANLRSYTKEQKDMVCSSLLKRADGMFLWVSSMIKLLENTPVGQLEQNIQQTPKDINGVYKRVLEEIPKDSEETVSNILKWVLYALRPLSLQELGIACTFRKEHTSHSAIPQSQRDAIQEDIKFCGPILKIFEDKTVHLVHQTTREYLLQSYATQVPVSRFLTNEIDAQFDIALTCLAYLSLEDFGQRHEKHFEGFISTRPNKSFFEQYPLIEYASVSWHRHTQHIGAKSSKLLEQIDCVLLNEKKRELWSNIYKHVARDRLPSRQSKLQLLIRFNLLFAAEKTILSGSDDVLHKDPFGGTALHNAARAGYESIVELLLANPGCRSAIDQTEKFSHHNALISRTEKVTYSTPLHLACRNGHDKVVGVLLSHGANIESIEKETERKLGDLLESSSSRTRTSIHLAARYGHLRVVEVLLEYGANIKAIESVFEEISCSSWAEMKLPKLFSPLDLASQGRHTDVCKLLIERAGNATPSDNGTPSPQHNDQTHNELSGNHEDHEHDRTSEDSWNGEFSEDSDDSEDSEDYESSGQYESCEDS